ncbi:MAG: Crp/Fnr family transcriptional regulator [Bacteroidetes bacterium]|nr:Crp/Fnr family transcriptional regulator [Bacteroidota bacterium]
MNEVFPGSQPPDKILLQTGIIREKMNWKDLRVLHQAGVSRHIENNKVIHVTGTVNRYLYFLQKGMMKISTLTEDGNEVIKSIIREGEFFGELSLLGSEGDPQEVAVAMGCCEVCLVRSETVRQLMATNECLCRNINEIIGRRIRRNEKRMLSLMVKDVKGRILDFLKEFVTEFGYPVEGGYKAKNFLTHWEIASITATSRQSVTTSLTQFRKKGLIDYNTNTVCVFDISNSR